MRVIHLSPHPDDESIGCPGTLQKLLKAGHQVTNLAVSLGREEDTEVRKSELIEACRRSGVTLEIMSPPANTRSFQPNPGKAALDLSTRLQPYLRKSDLVISPSRWEIHPGHALVAIAAKRAMEANKQDITWWSWPLWGDIPKPTLLVELSEQDMSELIPPLEAHSSQIERNNYLRLLPARAQLQSIVGPERVFGFGAEGISADYAEVLREERFTSGLWQEGRSRVLSPDRPLG